MVYLIAALLALAIGLIGLGCWVSFLYMNLLLDLSSGDGALK